jgi:hypothetical protein
VLAVDEWETAEQFEKFFGDPKMLEFIGSIGGDTSTPPEITVAEAWPHPTSSDRRGTTEAPLLRHLRC